MIQNVTYTEDDQPWNDPEDYCEPDCDYWPEEEWVQEDSWDWHDPYEYDEISGYADSYATKIFEDVPVTGAASSSANASSSVTHGTPEADDPKYIGQITKVSERRDQITNAGPGKRTVRFTTTFNKSQHAFSKSCYNGFIN